MSSNSESPSCKSVPQGVEKKNQKTYINGNCEVCNIPVGKKNRPDHEKGKKHKHNLEKYLKRRGRKTNARSNSFQSPSNLRFEEADSEATENNASNTEKSRIIPDESFHLDETPPSTTQQSPENEKVNPRVTKRNNSPTMSRQNKPYNDYSGPSRPSRGHNRPPRRGYVGQYFANDRRPPWNERYQSHSPQYREGYGYRGRGGWHSMLKHNRYFKDNRNPDEMFFMDKEGAYNNQYDPNENYYPFETAQYPLRSESNPVDSSTPKTVKQTEPEDLEKVPAKSAGDEKVPRAKPLKRINQSVRAIRNASIASRNSVDSDDSHQDGTSDKQTSKKNAPSEGMSGKRISHWINPSNPKDEAEVRRMVTNFSRSRKKENLLMLKQQSEDKKTDETGSITQTFDLDKCCSSPQSEDSSIEILEPSPVQKTERRAAPNSKRRSLNLEPQSDSDSRHSSKTRPLQAGTSPRKSSGERKRKSESELTSSKPKKRTSSADLTSILDSVIRGDTDPSLLLDLSLINKAQNSPQEVIKESTTVAIVPKKEPVESVENNHDQLRDFLQNQQLSLETSCSAEATMTPVESLINLFASGNIKVKKEFDDPLIDAIRTLDPAVLNKVCDNQPSPSVTNATIAQPSLQETQPLAIEPSKSPSPAAENPPVKPSPSVTLSLKAILKELEKISKKERRIKDSLQEADRKIQEYQVLLDEWKTKKLKIQSEEEILGHQRNTLVKSMNDIVSDEFTVPDFLEDTILDSATPQDPSVDETRKDSSSNIPALSTEAIPQPRETASPNAPTENVQEKEVCTNSKNNTVEEEIAVLPAPIKSENIPVIDLVDDPVEPSSVNGTLLNEDSLNDELSNWKELTAHQVVVNAIEVFDGYIYTCSLDNTAKRFSLSDPSNTVTYLHEKKNVTQLLIEKINGLTVVFTVCSGSTSISAFKAENGTLLNTLNFQSSVASICRGRGEKIYAGLRDGTIFTCNWKEQKEIINIGDNLRSIALTQQGCLSILITLAVNGSVSIRDAERNGLLIRTAKSVKNVPLSMKVYGDCIYLSGSGHVIILEIGTAKCVGQYEISHPYTSLTTSHGYIFTTSYSGLVRCYSQFGEKAVQVYYGAGKNSLTCITVYNNWVFTGNRFGVVDVFKFNPYSLLPCQVGKCDVIFSQEKDLELHILSGTDHDIPSGGSKCAWRNCRETIPKNCDADVIKHHIQEHIQSLHFQEERTLYNFPV